MTDRPHDDARPVRPPRPLAGGRGFSLPFGQNRAVSRRDALLTGLAACGTAGTWIAATSGRADDSPARSDSPSAATDRDLTAAAPVDERRASPRRHRAKKSINLWAFPYPDRMNLQECLQLAKDAGFDGVELNYDLKDDLSPDASDRELAAIRQMADRIGIEISGLCSFLFWPYPLTSHDAAKRQRGIELAGLIGKAAHQMGVENVLVVPGAVSIPWRDDHEPVALDVCQQRAREAIGQLVPAAERMKISLNMENIFFNGFLMTPGEMVDFVDSFGSPHVQVHFDTGNISLFQHPEHWVPILGERTKNIHFKEFSKNGTDYSLESFRPLLDGTTDWPAVMASLEAIDYDGFVTFEYFHPYLHYPEALIYQTSDSLDRILGRVG